MVILFVELGRKNSNDDSGKNLMNVNVEKKKEDKNGK